jgi:hypothetical protein
MTNRNLILPHETAKNVPALLVKDGKRAAQKFHCFKSSNARPWIHYAEPELALLPLICDSPKAQIW